MLKNVFKISMLSVKNVSNMASAPLSLFRQNFPPRTEDQLNVQINLELNASQAYLAMSNFFGQTQISLKGTSSFFLAMSTEERAHALLLINYVNMRGGRVKMNSIGQPKDEFTSLSMAIEEALMIERTNTTTLMELLHVSDKDGDVVTADYIVSTFVNEQVSHLVD